MCVRYVFESIFFFLQKKQSSRKIKREVTFDSPHSLTPGTATASNNSSPPGHRAEFVPGVARGGW